MIASGTPKNYLTKRLFLLPILPILFVVTSLINRQQFGPYWLGRNSDPEYAYLLNFLNIIQLRAPGHTDHPGTPLQIYGGIIVQVTYLIQALTHSVTSNITEAVLQNPEFYLVVVNTTLLIFTAVCLFLVGLVCFLFSQNIVLSLLLQLDPFLWTTVSESTRVRPEALLIGLTQLLVILLLFYLYSEADKQQGLALAVGSILGLGIATKVTFIPLGLLILLLPGFRQKKLAIFALVATFFLVTLPIASQYFRVFNWFLSIATHTGQYGGGNQGLVNVSELPNTFSGLVQQDKLFFYIVGLSALNFLVITFLLAWYRLKYLGLQNAPQALKIKKFYRLLACLLLIILVQLLITLKHPAIHYLLPSMGLFSLLILTQASLLAEILASVFQPITIKIIGLIAFGFYSVVIVNNALDKTSGAGRSNESYIAEIQAIDRMIRQDYELCTHVKYYRSSDQEYALKFGNGFASAQFSQPLQAIYPDGVFYNIWSHKYESFTQELDFNTLLDEKCMILQGTPLTQEDHITQYLSNAKIALIFEGSNEAIYLIVKDR
jgi:hypothetical protein